MRTMIKPSNSHLAHLATGKRFASLPHRLLATTNGLVIALALSLLPLIDAVADDIEYSSQSIINWWGGTEDSTVGPSLCRTLTGGAIFCPPSRVELSLPQFNPALGTLRGVDFFAQISLLGDVSTRGNSSGLFGRKSTATLGGSAAIFLDSSGINFGPNLELSILNQAQCTSGLFIGSCSSGSGTFGDSTNRTETFTGAHVTPFVGQGKINFYSGFDGNTGIGSYFVRLSQTDGRKPKNGFDSGLLEAGFCGDAAECLLLLAVGLYETGGISSDCCEGFGGLSIDRSLDIVYLYDPPASAGVPEPGTLSLLGLGLAGAAFLRRRKKH